MSMPGFFSGIKIDGSKLSAPTFEFFDSFKADEEQAFRRLMEMAEKTPQLWGLSIEGYGYGVFVDLDGNEYSQRPDDLDLLYEGMPAFRVTRLTAAAFVSEPAANTGLFASAKALFSGKSSLAPADVDLLAQAFVSFQKATADQNPDSTRFTSAPLGKGDHLNTTLHTTTTPMEKLILALAGILTDPAQLSAGQLYVVNHFASKPDMTVEDVQAHLKAEADKAERAELAAKAAKADQLEQEKAALEAKLAEKDKSFAELKQSGVSSGDINLGTAGTVGKTQHLKGATKEIIEFQASKGRVNLATTDLDDLWVPSIWVKHAQEMKPVGYGLLNTGVVVSDERLKSIAQGGGQLANMPLLHEPDFTDAVQTRTAPTVNAITADTGVTPFFNRVNTLGWDALSRTQSGIDGDIVGVANQAIVNMRWRNRFRLLLDILGGYFGTAVAALANNNFDEEGSNATSGQLWSSSMFHDAKAKMGEIGSNLQGGAVLVHPDIEAAMSKQDDVTTIRDSDGRFVVNTYKGIPIILSSLLRRAGTTDGYVYTSYILGPGSIGMADRLQTGEVGDQASLLRETSESLNQTTLSLIHI